MKYFLLLIFMLPILVHSQIIISKDSLTPPSDFTNIHVQKIAGDSLVSTFVIFIKENVPLHKHQYHSENVLILEGEGLMTLGAITKEIKAGDVIFIPANTFHEVKVTNEKTLKLISIQSPKFDGTDRVLYLKN